MAKEAWSLDQTYPPAEFEDAPFKLGEAVGVMVMGSFVVGDEVSVIRTMEFVEISRWESARDKLVAECEEGGFYASFDPYRQYDVDIASTDPFVAVPVDKATLALVKKLFGPSNAIGGHEALIQAHIAPRGSLP